jgi:hypothetical protein
MKTNKKTEQELCKKEVKQTALLSKKNKTKKVKPKLNEAVLKINLDNAAFTKENDGPIDELSRIFNDLAERIHHGNINHPYIIRDTNGNKIGEFKIL